MIEKLTKKQEEKLSVCRDKWLKIGLDTENEIDKEKAEDAIKLAYRCADLKEPKYFIYLKDPLEGCIGAALLSNIDQVRNQVRDQVWGQVLDQVSGQVWGQVGDQVLDQVGRQIFDQVADQVWDQVWGQVLDQVSGQVCGQVGDQVLDQVRNQVRNQVGDQVCGQVWDQVMKQAKNQINKCGYGSHDSGWLSFYNYFLDVCNLEICSRLNGLYEVSKHCGWWWPFSNCVIVTPKPYKIHRDENNRLHHESTSALEYKGGMKIYAWHGVRVPEKRITDKENIKIEDCFTWENIEQRRCLCEIIGWNKVLEKSECKMVHEDEYGELLETSSGATGGEACKFVLVVNPTDQRKFAIPVPMEMKRAKQAVAWTYFLEEDEYCPIVRT